MRAFIFVLFFCSSVFGVIGDQELIGFRGDANNDESVNISDMIYISEYVTNGGPAPQPCVEVGDANTDGSVDISDVSFLGNYLFSGGAAPYPETVTCDG